MKFTSTPRGARLARHLVAHRLDEWGYPCESHENETLTLITAELAANAVRHGHLPGRDFSVRLTATVDPPATDETLRIEVADTRTEQRPPSEGCLDTPPPDIESGRGLFLVSQLADRWGLAPRAEAPGKLVWAQLTSAGRAVRAGRRCGVLDRPPISEAASTGESSCPRPLVRARPMSDGGAE